MRKKVAHRYNLLGRKSTPLLTSQTMCQKRHLGGARNYISPKNHQSVALKKITNQ